MRVLVATGGRNVSQVTTDPTSVNPKQETNVSQYKTGPIMDDLISSIGAAKEAEKWAKAAAESAEAAKESEVAAQLSSEVAGDYEAQARSHATNALLAESESTRQAQLARLAAEYAQNSEAIAQGYVAAAREYRFAAERFAINSEAHASRSFSYASLAALSKEQAGLSADAAKESEDNAKASENNVKLSEEEVLRIGSTVEGIYEEFRKGASYGGTWNPNTGAYPAKPRMHTVWDVVLNPEQSEHTWNNIKWEPGDRLVFDSVQDAFYNINFPAKVVSVNGVTGAVVITPENIGAHPNTWKPTTADISGEIDFGVIT